MVSARQVRKQVERAFRPQTQQLFRQSDTALAQQQQLQQQRRSLLEQRRSLSTTSAIRGVTGRAGLVQRRQSLQQLKQQEAGIKQSLASVKTFQSQIKSAQRQLKQAQQKAAAGAFKSGAGLGLGATALAGRGFTGGQSVLFSTAIGRGVDIPGLSASQLAQIRTPQQRQDVIARQITSPVLSGIGGKGLFTPTPVADARGAGRQTLTPLTIIPVQQRSVSQKNLLKVINEKLGITPAAFERRIKRTVTEPFRKKFKKATGLEVEEAAQRLLIPSEEFVTASGKPTSPFQKKARAFAKGVVGGVALEAVERPVASVRNTALFFALPAAIGIGGKALAPAAKVAGRFTPKAIKSIGKFAINKGLLAAYLGSTGLEISKEPSLAGKGQLIGRKLISEGAPFVVGTRLGVKGELKKNLQREIDSAVTKLPKGKREQFKQYVRQIEVLKKAESVPRDVSLEGLDRIPQNARAPILKFLKQNNVIVGGSVGQRTQVKVKRSLAESDIDAYLETGNPAKKARELRDLLKSQGVERVSAIGNKITIRGKKVLEFQTEERLLQNILSVTPFWKNPRQFIVRTPSGIKVPKIEIQAGRKLFSGLADPSRAPESKIKDLKDFKDISDQLFRRAELQARNSFFFKKSRIRQLEKEFGVKLPIETFKKGGKLIKSPLEVGTLKVGKGIKPKLSERGPTKFNTAITDKAGTKPFTSGFKKPKLKSSQLPSQIKVRKPFAPLSVFGKPSQPKVDKPSQPLVTPFDKPSQLPAKKPKGPPPVPKPFTPSGGPSQPAVKAPGKPPVFRVPKPFPTRDSKVPKLKKPPKKITPGKPRKIVKKTKPLFDRGYFVFFKEKGKFKRLNKRPITLNQARDLGSDVTDHSLANTFKIRKAIGRPKQAQFKIKVNYLQRNQRKFRTFRIKKGKKIPLKNTFIEKRGKARLDKRTEIQKLGAAAYAARLRKRVISPGPIFKRTRLIKLRRAK